MLGELSSGLSLTMGFLRLSIFSQFFVSFFRGSEGIFLATPQCFSWLKRTKFWKIKTFLFSALNLKDVPYKNDSPEPRTGLMLNMFCTNMHFCFVKIVASFVQKPKSGLNLANLTFYFSYSGPKCNCWLKSVNHWKKPDDGVMWAGKENKSGLKLVRIKPDVAKNTCRLLLRKTNKQCDINIVLLWISVI